MTSKSGKTGGPPRTTAAPEARGYTCGTCPLSDEQVLAKRVPRILREAQTASFRMTSKSGRTGRPRRATAAPEARGYTCGTCPLSDEQVLAKRVPGILLSSKGRCSIRMTSKSGKTGSPPRAAAGPEARGYTCGTCPLSDEQVRAKRVPKILREAQTASLRMTSKSGKAGSPPRATAAPDTKPRASSARLPHLASPQARPERKGEGAPSTTTPAGWKPAATGP